MNLVLISNDKNYIKIGENKCSLCQKPLYTIYSYGQMMAYNARFKHLQSSIHKNSLSTFISKESTQNNISTDEITIQMQRQD